MRITFITPQDSLTGGIRVIATYAKCLQRLGHSVLIVCAPPDRPENLRLALRALRRADHRDRRRVEQPRQIGMAVIFSERIFHDDP